MEERQTDRQTETEIERLRQRGIDWLFQSKFFNYEDFSKTKQKAGWGWGAEKSYVSCLKSNAQCPTRLQPLILSVDLCPRSWWPGRITYSACMRAWTHFAASSVGCVSGNMPGIVLRSICLFPIPHYRWYWPVRRELEGTFPKLRFPCQTKAYIFLHPNSTISSMHLGLLYGGITKIRNSQAATSAF